MEEVSKLRLPSVLHRILYKSVLPGKKNKVPAQIFNARKRSLGQGNVFRSVCQSFCSQGEGFSLWTETPWTQTHLDRDPPDRDRPMPTGMYTCFCRVCGFTSINASKSPFLLWLSLFKVVLQTFLFAHCFTNASNNYLSLWIRDCYVQFPAIISCICIKYQKTIITLCCDL